MSIIHVTYRVGQKMAPFIVRLITSPNINRLKILSMSESEDNLQKTVTIDTTTPKVCHYATLGIVR